MAVRPAIIGVHHPDVGKRFGVYWVLSVLGEGGMSRVYLAEHTRLGRKVALKRLKTPFSENTEAVRAFFDEAKTINRIHHAHIVDVTDFVEDGELVYCVMELLEGQTVARAIELEGTLTSRRALHIAHQVCEALTAAHREGVVHLDIKPANIFLTAQGAYHDYVKLLDFGVARLFGSEAEAEAEAAVDNGEAPPHAGTPIYMAPEQATGGKVDHRSDLYSLGVTLYEMLSGKPPFQADGRAGYVYQHQHVVPAPLHRLVQLSEPVPASVSRIVSRCLAKAPTDRYASAEALRADLAKEARSQGLALRPGEMPKVVQPPRDRRRLATGLAVALAAAALAVGGFFLVRGLVGRSRMAAPAPTVSADARVPAPVTLTLNTNPPKAEVVRIAPTREVLGVTPLRLTVPRTSTPWRLRIRLRGYQPRTSEIVLDRNQGVTLDLQPVPPPRPEAMRAPPPETLRAEPMRPPPHPIMTVRRPPPMRRRPPLRPGRPMTGGGDQIVDPFK